MTIKNTALTLALTAVLTACASSGSNTQSASPSPAATSTSSSTSSSSTAKPAASSNSATASSAPAPSSQGTRGLNRFPIQDVLTGPESSKFSGVKFYFGKQKTPAVARKFSEERTSQRTNSFNKTAAHACRIVMASALLRFQDAARRMGADAVINIRSNYDNVEFSSETEYECMEGGMLAGVALKGDFVKLK